MKQILWMLVLVCGLIGIPASAFGAPLDDSVSITVDTSPTDCSNADGCAQINARGVCIFNRGANGVHCRCDPTIFDFTITGRDAFLTTDPQPLCKNFASRRTTCNKIVCKTASGSTTVGVHYME